MDKVIAIGHIVLTVKDLSKSFDWYNDVLGWLGYKVAFRDEKQIYFTHKNTGMVAIFQGHTEFSKDTFNRYRVGLHHLAIQVEKKEIVDELYKFLKEKGYNISDEPKDYPEYGDYYYSVFFNDFDGIRLEVYFEKN